VKPFALALGALAFVSFLHMYCSPTQTPVIIGGIGDTVACVLSHLDEPPEQIAMHCGGLAVEEVVKILTAHRAAMAREQARDAGPGK
jgi:hypothetical protein